MRTALASAAGGVARAARSAVSWLSRRCPHRQVALLDSSPRDATQLLERLLASERGRARVLLLGAPGGAGPDPQQAGNSAWRAVRALYLPPRSTQRRRWVLHLADDARPGPATLDAPWMSSADTALVCLSFRELRGPSPSVVAALDGFVRDLGFARDQGRLRRAALVVTELPSDVGPYHDSQVVCHTTPRRSFVDDVESQLGSARGIPGHPLADVRWGAFLRELTRHEHVAGFVENVHRALGAECPLLFVPGAPRAVDASMAVMDWLHGARAADHSKLARAAKVAAVAATVVLALLAVAHLHVPRRALPTSASTPDARLEAVRYERAAYSWIERGVLRGRSAEPALAEAETRLTAVILERNKARSAEEAEARRRALVEKLRPGVEQSIVALDAENDAALAGVSDPRADRARIATDCMQKLDLRLATEREWKAAAENAGAVPELAPAWEKRLARAAMRCGIASIELVDDVFVSREGVAQRAEAALVQLGQPDRATELNALVSSASQPRLRTAYGTWELRQATPVIQVSTASGAPSLAPADLNKELAAIEKEPLRSILANPPAFDKRLGDLSGRAAGAANGYVSQRVQRLQQALAALLAERPLVIAFRSAEGDRWHLDLSTGKGGYVPAQWRAGGCKARVNTHAGARLEVSFNWRTPIHASTANGACATGHATTLQLIERSGDITVDGRTVHYEIDDWPTWPPQL